MELISHDDRTLKEHLSGLKNIIDTLLKEKTQNLFKIEELNKTVNLLITYHDLGKASKYFQCYLVNSLISKNKTHKYYSQDELNKFLQDNKKYLVELQNNFDLKKHSSYGAWMTLFNGNKYDIYDINKFMIINIISSHHGYLKNFDVAYFNPRNFSETLEKISDTLDFQYLEKMFSSLNLNFSHGNIKELLNNIKIRKINKLIENITSERNGKYYFKMLFLFSILLSADKGDVMLNNNKEINRILLSSNVIENYKRKNFVLKNSIDNLRESAYSTILKNLSTNYKKNIYSITLPTGLGKTLAAYKVALKLKELYFPSFRIIYCLPFTSIIDQNAGIFKNILKESDISENNVNIHHHLSVPKINDDDSTYAEWEYLTEGWQNEINITTFVQLWDSIFSCHNRQLRKFHNLANSIIILDEVQQMNPGLYPAFEFAIKCLSDYFNTVFIIITATQPILLENIRCELCEISGRNDYYFLKLNRTKIITELMKKDKMEENELTKIIKQNYYAKPCSTLVICNTIKYSQNLFKNILAQEIISNDNIFYLSAALIPYSRKLVLDGISEKLKRKENIILISTQVVEAGVDLDFDLVYRDFAPLPSINQAAGRCNRNNTSKNTSRIYIFKSGKHKIYDPTLLNITNQIFANYPNEIKENQFYNLNSEYFKLVKEKIQEKSSVSNELIQCVLKLQFERICDNDNFRLISKKYITNNFYININEESNKLWNKYLSYFSIKEHFERKRKIKMLLPELLQFVVEIPIYIYKPNNIDKNKLIINDEDWNSFYDIEFGYYNSTTNDDIVFL